MPSPQPSPAESIIILSKLLARERGQIEVKFKTCAQINMLKTHSSQDYQLGVQNYQKELTDFIQHGAKLTGKKTQPLRFIHELQQIADDNTIVISDIGSHYMWLSRYFFCYQPHHLLFSNGQQTLGVALPWAIAAGMVDPSKKILSISGDGGFLFSATEYLKLVMIVR